MDQQKDFKELNDLLTIRQVAKRLPSREGSKGKSIQAVRSWADNGLKGVRLKTIQVGGIRYMTWEWVLEFFERVDFHFESLSKSFVFGQMRIEHFHRGWFVRLDVHSFEHGSHAAAPQAFADFVWP